MLAPVKLAPLYIRRHETNVGEIGFMEIRAGQVCRPHLAAVAAPFIGQGERAEIGFPQIGSRQHGLDEHDAPYIRLA